MKKLTDSLVKKFFKTNFEFTPKTIARLNEDICTVSFGPMQYQLYLITYRDWTKVGKVFNQHIELNITHNHSGQITAFYNVETLEMMDEKTWEYHDKRSEEIRKEHEYACIEWLESRNDCTISEKVIEQYRRG